MSKAPAAARRGFVAVAEVEPGGDRALVGKHDGHALANAARSARNHDAGAAQTLPRHNSSPRSGKTYERWPRYGGGSIVNFDGVAGPGLPDLAFGEAHATGNRTVQADGDVRDPSILTSSRLSALWCVDSDIASS